MSFFPGHTSATQFKSVTPKNGGIVLQRFGRRLEPVTVAMKDGDELIRDSAGRTWIAREGTLVFAGASGRQSTQVFNDPRWARR